MALLLVALIQDVAWIDTHLHLDGKVRDQTDYDGAVAAAIKAMDEYGIRRAVVLPTPQPPDWKNGYDCGLFADAVKKHPTRFAFLGGGGTLNAMIHAKSEDQAAFRAKAEEILASGAVGFGEITPMHLSHADWHPYECVPADHPLLLLLADVAAEHDVVIDLHLDLVAREKPLPKKFKSPPNPEKLAPNLEAFERLLEHDRKARIVWVHVGWDQTGDVTAELCRSLLKKHENLFMSLKLNPAGMPEHSPMAPTGLKPEWSALFADYSDRFVIGSDVFVASPNLELPVQRGPVKTSLEGPRRLLSRLPPELARKIGVENAERLYKLKD